MWAGLVEDGLWQPVMREQYLPAKEKQPGDACTTLAWSLMTPHVSGTSSLYSCAKAWFPVRGAPKV